MESRGLFIVFEGLDRSGKSTQSAMMADHLAKTSAVTKMNFPNRNSQTGQLLNSYLQQTQNMNNQAVHLLFAMNRWEQKESLVETLEKGTHVICDRYAFSGVAYSAAKGLDFQWCLNADRGMVKPDLVLYMDVDL